MSKWAKQEAFFKKSYNVSHILLTARNIYASKVI